MPKLELRLCDLNNGDRSVKAFDDEAATLAWLKDRPSFVDVLGVATEDIDKETNARLRAAMRPLDDAEKAAEKVLEQEYVKARLEREAAEQAANTENDKAYEEEMATADPNRLMEVRWRYDGTMEVVEKVDTREISAEAKEAVLEWVRERDTWVENRNQVVGEARVFVYPGALPDGVTDRAANGSFVPVAAPEKKKN